MNPERNRENDEIQEINQPKQSELSDTEKDEMKRDLEANKPEFEHQGELEQIAGRENAEDQSVEKDINFSDEENINENDDNVDIDISDDLNVSFDAQNDVGDGNLLEEETRGNSDISIGEDELSLTDSENLNEDALEQNGDAFEETSNQDGDNDLDRQKVEHRAVYGYRLINALCKAIKSISAQIDAAKEAREQGLQTNEDGIVVDSLSKVLDEKDRFEETLEKEVVPKMQESLKDIAEDEFGTIIGGTFADIVNDVVDSIGQDKPHQGQSDIKENAQEKVAE